MPASIINGIFANEAADTQASAARDAANTSAGASRYASDIQKQIYDQTRADQTPWRQAGVSALNRLAQLIGVSGGLSSDQLRAQLLPKYTTTTSQQVPVYAPQSSGPSSFLFSNQPEAIGYTTQQKNVIDEQGLQKAIADALSSQQTQTAQQADYGALMKPFSMADYQADPGYAFRLSEGMKGIQNSAAARGGLLSGAALKAIQKYGQDAASQEYGNAYNRYQTNQANQFNRLASLAGVGQTANNALQTAGQNYANNVGGYAINQGDTAANAALASGQARASMYTGLGNSLGRTNWGNTFNSIGNMFGSGSGTVNSSQWYADNPDYSSFG